MKNVTIWSKGTRMAGDLYAPENMKSGEKYPAVVCCHGWSAPLKSQMVETGLPQKLASSGYFVLTFDYRGWGESDGVIYTEEPLPKGVNEGIQRIKRAFGIQTDTDALEKGVSEATLRVKIVREVFDPVDWVTDIEHAIDFIEGEPGVDTERIGIWGSSVGGGLVVWVAANDPRVKCVVSQVGAHNYGANDLLGSAIFPAWSQADIRERAIQQARSSIYPLPMPEKIYQAMGGLLPGPVNSSVRYFAPLEWAEKVKVPILIMDAENEPLYDKNKHAGESFRRIKAVGTAPVEYRIIQGIEHGWFMYSEMGGAGNARALVDLAVDWFNRYL